LYWCQPAHSVARVNRRITICIPVRSEAMDEQEHPILIRDIDHIVLRVIDLEKMLSFYCGVLGCSLERRQDDLGLVQLRAGNSLIDLIPIAGKLGSAGGAAPATEGRNMDHFCLRIRSFDQKRICDYLADCGINFGKVSSRYGADGHGPSIYLNDPEGNTVELKGPPS
jgi:glyoxylase I family protein